MLHGVLKITEHCLHWLHGKLGTANGIGNQKWCSCLHSMYTDEGNEIQSQVASQDMGKDILIPGANILLSSFGLNLELLLSPVAFTDLLSSSPHSRVPSCNYLAWGRLAVDFHPNSPKGSLSSGKLLMWHTSIIINQCISVGSGRGWQKRFGAID